MPDRDGVEIYKRFYPWPDGMRIGDTVLVREVTGLKWPDFLNAQNEYLEAVEDAKEMGDEQPEPDPVLFAGMLAVAFWQGNPTMSRDKVRRAIERLDMDDIELIDGDEGEADVGPPAQGGVEAAVPQALTTSNASELLPEQYTETTLPGSSSGEMSPNGSGLPGSPITSPESFPA